MKKATLLIFGMDDLFRQNLKGKFFSQGFLVFEAGSESEISVSLKEFSPDLIIISSTKSSSEHGLKEVQAVRSLEKYLPIILITKFSSEARAIAALRAGVTDYFGLKEFNVKSQKERIRRYRRYVYEAGAVNRSDKMQAKVIDDKVVARARKNEFEISRISRFRHRTRYFTHAGIIGSKEFVSSNYRRFKHLFYSKHEKKPKPIKGLDGMYSLKRLSEVI